MQEHIKELKKKQEDQKNETSYFEKQVEDNRKITVELHAQRAEL